MVFAPWYPQESLPSMITGDVRGRWIPLRRSACTQLPRSRGHASLVPARNRSRLRTVPIYRSLHGAPMLAGVPAHYPGAIVPFGEASMSNSTGLDDEEFTPVERLKLGAPIRALAAGEFRTHETTISTLAFDDIYEVCLASEGGDVAHFAVDSQLAPRLVAELKRQLSDPDYRSEFLRHRPASPRRERLDEPGTHIFFAAMDEPQLSVERERGGDRIILMLYDTETSLHITFQVGIAIDLCEFFTTTCQNL